MKKLSDILSDESKWCQFNFVDGEKMCLEGALQDAIRKDGELVRGTLEYHNALGVLNSVISDCSRFNFAHTFNDRATYEEVYAVAVEFDRRMAWRDLNGITLQHETFHEGTEIAVHEQMLKTMGKTTTSDEVPQKQIEVLLL